MAAGLGFKDFTTGEVLTANDVDGYLMQGIWVFANATARDAAVTSPQEGNACYLKDTDVIMVYSGSAWATQSASNPISANIVDAKGDLIAATAADTVARLAVGTNNQVLTADSSTATGLKWATPSGGALILTGSADFTTSTAININNCFSATYLNYMVQINLTASSATDSDILYRMRASGTDDTSSNYIRQRIYQRGVTLGGTTETGTSMSISEISTTYVARTYRDLYLNDPFIAKPTTMVSNSNNWNSSNENNQFRISGVHNVSTSYDGITIYPSSGNITGKIRIYGYTLS